MTEQNPDPSPAEIKAMCLQIQASWTPAEKLRRLRVDLRPMIRAVDGLEHKMTAEDYTAHTTNLFPKLKDRHDSDNQHRSNKQETSK